MKLADFSLDTPVTDFSPRQALAEHRRIAFLADRHRDELTRPQKRQLGIREHQLRKQANGERTT